MSVSSEVSLNSYLPLKGELQKLCTLPVPARSVWHSWPLFDELVVDFSAIYVPLAKIWSCDTNLLAINADKSNGYFLANSAKKSQFYEKHRACFLVLGTSFDILVLVSNAVAPYWFYWRLSVKHIVTKVKHILDKCFLLS